MTNDSQQSSGPLLGEVGGEHRVEERRLYADEVAAHRDEVLQLHGSGDLALYERLLRDDQVQACFQQRRTAVTSLPLMVDAGGDRPIDREAADHLREQLNSISFDHICYKMLAALMHGRGIGECLYRPEDGRVVLDNILVRRARRFAFSIDGALLMTDPRRERMPERKFWVFRCGGDDDDNLYGQGLGHWLYWPVWLKRNATRFWSLWCEKFAAPTALARGAAGMTEDEERKLLELLEAVTHGGRIVVPKHVAIELIESAREAGNSYELFVARMDRAISKVILSQTMTTDDGSSLSQATIHYKVSGAVTRSDSALLLESFARGPATWLTEWNFPGAATPILWRDGEAPEDLQARAVRDKTLSEMGYRPTPKYVAEVYGDGFEFVPPPPAASYEPPRPPASFAAPLPPSNASADELLVNDWREVIGPEVEAAEELLRQSRSLTEFRVRLGELARRDPQRLTDRLARMLFAATLSGELEDHDESDG